MPSTVRKPGPLAGGSDARVLLLDAAEQLFALHGVEAVSLRAVTTAAGLTSATLHYHFRSRDELLEAILQRRRESLQTDAFARMENGGAPVSVDALVRGVIEPWVALVRNEPERGPLFLRLYSQLLAARDHRLQDSMGGLTDQFRRLYSRLPGPAASPLRWGIAIDCLIHELAAIADLRLGAAAFAEHVDTLLDFVISGLRGPAGP